MITFFGEYRKFFWNCATFSITLQYLLISELNGLTLLFNKPLLTSVLFHAVLLILIKKIQFAPGALTALIFPSVMFSETQKMIQDIAMQSGEVDFWTDRHIALRKAAVKRNIYFLIFALSASIAILVWVLISDVLRPIRETCSWSNFQGYSDVLFPGHRMST